MKKAKGDWAVRFEATPNENWLVPFLALAEITGEANAANQWPVHVHSGRDKAIWHDATILAVGTREEMDDLRLYRSLLEERARGYCRRMERALEEAIQTGNRNFLGFDFDLLEAGFKEMLKLARGIES